MLMLNLTQHNSLWKPVAFTVIDKTNRTWWNSETSFAHG